MRRLTLVLVVLAVFAVPGSALARTYGSPGSMTDGEYKYVENPDGTFTEYYRNEAGAVQRGSTYSNTGMAEADRLVRQTSTDAGTSGQTGGSVAGSDGNDIYASEHILDDIRTGKPYLTPGEEAVGDEIVADAEATGTLPSFAAVAGSMAGVVVASAGAFYVGVTIGDGLAELVGWQHWEPFGEGHNALESSGTERRSAKWNQEVWIGELKTCHKVVPFVYATEESAVKCFEAGSSYTKTTELFSEGKWSSASSRVPETSGTFTVSGGIPMGETGSACPGIDPLLSCYSPAANEYHLYEDYVHNPPKRHMFPALKGSVEEYQHVSKAPSGGLPARSPVTTPISVAL